MLLVVLFYFGSVLIQILIQLFYPPEIFDILLNKSSSKAAEADILHKGQQKLMFSIA
jgi:hypothetical protein